MGCPADVLDRAEFVPNANRVVSRGMDAAMRRYALAFAFGLALLGCPGSSPSAQRAGAAEQAAAPQAVSERSQTPPAPNLVAAKLDALRAEHAVARLHIDTQVPGVKCLAQVLARGGAHFILDVDLSPWRKLKTTATAVSTSVSMGPAVTQCEFPNAAIFQIEARPSLLARTRVDPKSPRPASALGRKVGLLHAAGTGSRIVVDAGHSEVICPQSVLPVQPGGAPVDLDPAYPLSLVLRESSLTADLVEGGVVTRCTFPYAAIRAVDELPAQAPSQVKQRIAALHQQGATARLVLNGLHAEVVCPESVLQANPEALVVDLNPAYPLRLALDRIALSADLSFGGVVSRCTFPYAAVKAVLELPDTQP